MNGKSVIRRKPNAKRTKRIMLISLDAERRERRADICTKKERNGYKDEKTKVSPSEERHRPAEREMQEDDRKGWHRKRQPRNLCLLCTNDRRPKKEQV